MLMELPHSSSAVTNSIIITIASHIYNSDTIFYLLMVIPYLEFLMAVAMVMYVFSCRQLMRKHNYHDRCHLSSSHKWSELSVVQKQSNIILTISNSMRNNFIHAEMWPNNWKLVQPNNSVPFAFRVGKTLYVLSNYCFLLQMLC